ncbi:MAG: hypothetical protein H7Y00_13960 [Fimbriimonadaceae bacterium]|nr:hypothetical protein [Chitinophagales bacterium]
MYRQLRFIKPDEETMLLSIPVELKGKLIEISIAEKRDDVDVLLEDDSSVLMINEKIEMQMLDKMRNQLYVWDI